MTSEIPSQRDWEIRKQLFSECVWESTESEYIHCALVTSSWAGYSLHLVPWDPPFLQTLLHRAQIHFHQWQWQSSHWKASRSPGLLGYVGWIWSCELWTLLTSPEEETCLNQQVSQTPQLVLNTIHTSQRNRQPKALPPNLPVRRAFLKSLPNAKSKSTSWYSWLVTESSFYIEGLEGSMSWLRYYSFEKSVSQVQKKVQYNP